MKKTVFILVLLGFLLNGVSLADTYFFKGCEISGAVKGNYIINLEQNVIEVQLKSEDGREQNISDEIKSIEDTKIISKKIKSTRGENLYYQYFLDSTKKSVIKLQYKKESGIDMDVFKLTERTISFCMNVNGGWNKAKIEKAKAKKEAKEILKAQEELKKEEEAVFKCQGTDFDKWTNCTGSYTAETGYKYSGIFRSGVLVKGISIYPGGAKYVGDFKKLKPHGYGTFVWKNGDKYYGQWKNGKSDGNGTKVWKNGTKYLGQFKNDNLHGEGTLFYPDGKKYEGGFQNGKRHGEGIFSYPDGTAYVGKFIAGKEQGVGDCIDENGISVKCKGKIDAQAKIKDYSGKDTRDISIVAKKWVRISQYEANSKKGKKIMDQLKSDFEIKAKELCAEKTYNVLEKKIEVLEIDETPAYGLETKLKIGINGVVECK